MAQGLLHNLVVWSGDLIQVVTRSIYYTLSFFSYFVAFGSRRLCSLTIHLLKKMIDDIQQRLRKKKKMFAARILLLFSPEMLMPPRGAFSAYNVLIQLKVSK